MLKLPAELQIALKDDQISMGHARALINISDDETKLRMLKKIIEQNLSVRQVEEMVRANAKPSSKSSKKIQLPEEYLQNKAQLIDFFNTKVDIKRNGNGLGNIIISFDSDEDFRRILKLIKS